MTVLTNQIESLERQCRSLEASAKRLRIILACVVGGLGLMALVGANASSQAPPPDYVVATGGFLLADKDGLTRAALMIDKTGNPSLQLYDRSSDIARVGLGLSAKGWTGLIINDSKGKERVFLGEGKEGTYSLLMAEEGKVRMDLTHDSTNTSSFVIRDKDGHIRYLTRVEPKGSSVVQLFGRDDKQPRIEGSVDEQNLATAVVRDRDGQLLMNVPQKR